MILVTAYERPDLDGTACAFAYAEFLQKSRKDAICGIFGNPHREAQFVLERFDIKSLGNGEKLIGKADSIIIVDASDLGGLSRKINPEKVVEIIDHRKVNQAGSFPNAKTQIEFVGAAATIIAEKFYSNRTKISEESAALLFSAIISNTVNFQANVTTERDKKMAKWLETRFDLSEDFIHEMFLYKSKFKKPIKEILEDDFATFKFNKTLGIAQLEIVNVDSFIDKELDKIKKALLEIKKKKSLDLIFLTCIDLEKAFNKLVVIDKDSQNLLEKSLNVKFENCIAKRHGIIMRKEIVPLIKSFLETKK